MSKLIEMTMNELYNFKQCPLRYQLVNVHNLTKELSETEGIRETVRTVVGYYFYNKQGGKEPSMENLKEKFGALWFGEMGLHDIKFDGNPRKRETFLNAVGMLNYFHRKEKYDKSEIVAVNMEFRVPFGDGFFVTGALPVVKRTKEGLELVIYKTGRQKYDEFWQKTDMEITLMAMAFESIFGQKADQIVVHNLNTAQTYYLSRKKKDYKRLYKSVNMVKKSIEEGWFYPRESFSCDKCPVKKYCMEWN